ncbi:hypothetical protein IAT38_001458 [Cryptococcus sp. DSM 104549]
MPSSSSSTPSEDQALLASFLALLNSPSPLAFPAPTLLGAFTHFLSALPDPSLSEFISSLIKSPSAWSTPTIGYGDIRNAVRLAVPAAVTRVETETADAYFASSRRRRRARAWLDSVIISAKKEEHTPQRTEVLVGLLQGLDDVEEMDWGGVRGSLEDAVVLGLVEMSELESASRGWMELLCAAMPHVAVDRLKVVDMKLLTSQLQQELYSTLTTSSTSSSDTPDAPALARALARAFTVLNTGQAPSKQASWGSMRAFCVRMQGIAEDMENQWNPDPEVPSDPTWETHKTALFSFLLPASTILDLLLEEASAPHADSYAITDLATRLLVTLAAFSYLTDASKGGFENYHRILYGSLDIIAARGGTFVTEELFGELSRVGRMTDARAAFVLIVGDELVRHLGSRSIGVLLPLAERHAHRPLHRSSYEAAHALFISLLRSSSETLATAHPQGDFFDALVPAYLAILCKQATSGDITADQLKEAFPIILSAASLRSNASINLCLTSLASLPPSPATRQTRILAAPYLPSPSLPAYLDDLAQMILGVERDSPERLELASTAFKMVVHDLRDEVKGVGVEWWMRWRWEFEGRERKEAGFLKSRL